jgi:hypothetical protein
MSTMLKYMNEGNKEENELRQLWIQGIPEKIRAKVWVRVTGNNNSLTESLFEIMANRGRKLRNVLKEITELNTQKERLIYEIEMSDK